jgi:hypothetical protein
MWLRYRIEAWSRGMVVRSTLIGAGAGTLAAVANMVGRAALPRVVHADCVAIGFVIAVLHYRIVRQRQIEDRLTHIRSLLQNGKLTTLQELNRIVEDTFRKYGLK